MLIRISIPNWSEYNARSDRANYSWFRFQNDFFTNQKLFGLTDAQVVLYLMLVSEVSKKNKPEIEINLEFVSAIRKTPVQKILKDLQELVSRGVVLTEACHQLVESLPATDRQTDNTNETDIAPAAPGAVNDNPVKVYCDSYKSKYGHSPVIGGKQSGILSRFAKDHPRVWPDLIRGYLEMPDSWAVARSHPVELLESKLNEITRFLKTGKVATKKVIEHTEAIVDKAQGTLRKPRRSIEELEAEKESQQKLLASGES